MPRHVFRLGAGRSSDFLRLDNNIYSILLNFLRFRTGVIAY
jgi:hypothetical protein